MKSTRSLLFFNLVKLLDKYKIANNDLAESLNLSISTLSHKMTGKTEWKINEMLEIQKQLNLLAEENYTLDYLFEKG